MVTGININASNRTLAILGVFGVLLAVGGTYFGFKFMPDLTKNKIWETKILKEDTHQWDLFVKTPFPFIFKIYAYDILNPNEILNGAKPKVKEVGPFIYKVFKWKNEIEWTTPDEISYNAYQRYEFDKEASGIHSENTEITILNGPLFAILLKVEETQPDAFGLLESALPEVFEKNDGIFIKVKIGDLLWRGIKFCENEGKDGGFAASMMCKQVIEKISESNNLRMENKTVLFANLFYKNNTHLGRYTIKSGQKHREETGILTHFNGKSYISAWSGEKSLCNKIRGVTTTFPADIQTDTILESYSEDICMHGVLIYDSEDTVKKLKGFKFVAKNDTFSSSVQEHSCFCVNKKSRSCVKDGIIDLSTCTGGPVMVSFPHFLYGDQEYLDGVEGLDPDRAKHESFLILEPISGTPLYGSQKVQFNTFLRPIEGMESTTNLSRALLPLLWMEESFIIPDSFVKKLNDSLFYTLSIVNIVKWISIISGGSCILIAGLTLVYKQAP